MTRALALVVLLAATAAAEPKPTIAIAIDTNDRNALTSADALTAALRKLAAGKTERFTPKASLKEMAAAAREAECSETDAACAVKIGAALGIDYVLTGEVELRGTHYTLVVGLVSTSRKERVRSLRDIVPTTIDPKKWAKRVYERVISVDTGELAIVANAKRGDVLIDGQVVGALFEGRVTLTGIAVGAHGLAIRAPGFKPLEVDVTVDGSTRETLLLDPL